MKQTSSIPQAWPLLMTKAQACAYMGSMDERTFLKICPVPPLDLGARVLRWHRGHLDQWVDGLPFRLHKPESHSNHDDVCLEMPKRTLTALDRAKSRAQKDQSCRKQA